MKIMRWFFVLAVLAVVALVLFYSRQIYGFKYEPEYYENYYYNSQWNVPNSTRGISDGDLFKFVGYRLAEGESPFDINYEVPPLGKYLYGLGEKYTGNPYWVSTAFYLGSLVVFYFLARDLFKREQVAWLSLFLFASTPFVATQVRDVMLDLPLMFMFLVHTFTFVRYLKKGKLVDLGLTGVFLGLASGTKLGIYAPLAILLETAFVLRTKKWPHLVVLPVTTAVGYVTAYCMYFIKHQNPIPWLRLHKKIYTFYSGSLGDIDYWNQLRTIFLNSYQGWWQPDKMIQVSDWSIVFPLGVIAIMIVLFFAIKKKEWEWVYVSCLTIVFLVMNNLVPFWPRYLMPAIPMFVLLLGYVFRKKGIILFLIAMLNLPVLVKVMSFEDLPGHTQAVGRFISTRAYRELYRSISTENRVKIAEPVFIETLEEFYDQLGTRDVQIELGEVKRKGDMAEMEYVSRYETRYGWVTREDVFLYEKVNGQWKLNWDWDYVWPGYGVDSELIIKEGSMPLLGLKDENEGVVARRGKGWEVYMIPRLMYNWNQNLDTLAYLTGEGSMVADERIKRTIPDDFPRYVGYFDPDRGEEGVALANSTAGIILREVDYLVSADGSSIGGRARVVNGIRPELFYVSAEIMVVNGEKEEMIIFSGVSEERDVVLAI